MLEVYKKKKWLSVRLLSRLSNMHILQAFCGYLGPLTENWKLYDSVELARTYSGEPREILIDQGTEDKFLKDGQLQPEKLEKVKNENVSISFAE